MNIEHIVISGGGPSGFISYGALREANIQKKWNINNIKTIYGTSIGGLLGVIIALNISWDILDDYLIKRPWEKVIKPNFFSLNGINGIEIIKILLEPLFKLKNIDINITLSKFKELFKIENHFITIDLNNNDTLLESNICYKTHPNITICEALSMTSAIPILFKPIFNGDGCYVDGGLLHNYPLHICIQDNDIKNTDIILSTKNTVTYKINKITTETSIIEYYIILIKKFHNTIETTHAQQKIKHEVECKMDNVDWVTVLSDENKRKELVNSGKQFFIKQLMMS